MLQKRSTRVAGLLLAALSLSGCAIKTPHLAISQWPVTSRALYYNEPAPYRLGVLPLVDQRPVQERKGQRPQGVFLLLWNRRTGDYYTSDQIFGDQVAEQLSRQLAKYLQVANTFTHVTPVSSLPRGFSPESLQDVAREHEVDYLLGGDVRHFFGSQHQHFSMWVLPLYFLTTSAWSDAKTLPWGQSAVQFYLFDGRTGDMMWRHQLEASKTLPRETDSMAEAAMESFVQVAGDLAIELRQLPLDSFPAVAMSDR